MARIRVYRPEAGGDQFPRVCMRCGQPAEVDVPQTFSWMPAWVSVLILAGLGPWIIVALILRRTMRVVAPMCLRHAGHWRNRKLYLWLGLLFWIAYAVALIALGDQVPEAARGPAILVGIFGGLAWLISAAVIMNSAIKPSEITDRRIDLVNVHSDFADEWSDVADEIRPAPRRSRDDRERTREQDTP